MKEKNGKMFQGRTQRSMEDPKRNQRKEKTKQYFEQKYNKLTKIEFKTKDQVNMNKHFYLPKNVINKELTKRALALYPVLCAFADFRESKWFQLSIQNLRKFSGMSSTTIYEALAELEADVYRYWDEDGEMSKVKTVERKKVTTGKRHYNMYKVEFYREGNIDANKGHFWIFNTMIIETGLWAKLSTRAKALYVYMRAQAKFDAMTVGDWFVSGAEDGEFRNRFADNLELHINEISTTLSINYDDVRHVIRELEDNFLCERYSEDCLVFLVPDPYLEGK